MLFVLFVVLPVLIIIMGLIGIVVGAVKIFFWPLLILGSIIMLRGGRNHGEWHHDYYNERARRDYRHQQRMRFAAQSYRQEARAARRVDDDQWSDF